MYARCPFRCFMVHCAMRYFVVQVRTGSEGRFAAEAKKKNPGGLVDAVFLQRRLRIRRQGKELLELQPLFAGYVFIITSDRLNGELFSAVRENAGFIHFLRSNEDITELGGQDLAVVKHFMSFGKIAEPSLACFDKNDRIVILDGPMKGLEGMIASVDRRKKRVTVITHLFHSEVKVNLSYTLVQKQEGADGPEQECKLNESKK